MVLIIDPQNAGIAGNMIVGAFIDLGLDFNEVKEVMETVASDFGGVKVSAEKVNKSGIEATFLEVETLDKKNKNNHSISYEDLLAKIDEIEKQELEKENTIFSDDIIDDVFEISKRVFKRIAKAEANVHGRKVKKVSFHEVGAADAVADVFGSVFAYCKMGFNNPEERVVGLTIGLGGGTVETSHGVIPIPSPAVVEMLIAADEGPYAMGNDVLDCELATPTGVAIYLELCNEFTNFIPMLKMDSVAYGAGSKNYYFPNVLRLIKGKFQIESQLGSQLESQVESQVESQTIDVIETNIDHLSGETIGYLFEKLMELGARDVAIIPIIMKKNRPGQLLKVISKKDTTENLVDVIFKETGTLGIRISQDTHRGVASRKIISIDTDIYGKKEKIRFKIGFIGDEIISSRPEYEDIKKIASKCNIPLNEVSDIANFEIKKYLANNELDSL